MVKLPQEDTMRLLFAFLLTLTACDTYSYDTGSGGGGDAECYQMGWDDCDAMLDYWPPAGQSCAIDYDAGWCDCMAYYGESC